MSTQEQRNSASAAVRILMRKMTRYRRRLELLIEEMGHLELLPPTDTNLRNWCGTLDEIREEVDAAVEWASDEAGINFDEEPSEPKVVFRVVMKDSSTDEVVFMQDADLDTATAHDGEDLVGTHFVGDPVKWAQNLWAKMRPDFGDRPMVLRLYRVTDDRAEEMKV